MAPFQSWLEWLGQNEKMQNFSNPWNEMHSRLFFWETFHWAMKLPLSKSINETTDIFSFAIPFTATSKISHSAIPSIERNTTLRDAPWLQFTKKRLRTDEKTTTEKVNNFETKLVIVGNHRPLVLWFSGENIVQWYQHSIQSHGHCLF